jgi:hypothetical protein
MAVYFMLHKYKGWYKFTKLKILEYKKYLEIFY